MNFDGEGQKPDNRSLAYIVIGTLDKLNVFQSLQIFILMRKNKVCLSRKMKIKKKKKKAIMDGQKLLAHICPEKWNIHAAPEAINSLEELGFPIPSGYKALGKEESISPG